MTPPRSCWLSPALEPRPSAIVGLGLFAVRPIAGGEVVIRLGGTVIDGAALARLQPPYSSVTLGQDAHLLIDPDHPVRFGNHGWDPNLWHLDVLTIAARRAIAASEEATIDYATHTAVEAWSMDCRCGSPICRGRITGADWRLAALQGAYGEHWTPLLKDRIKAAP